MKRVKFSKFKIIHSIPRNSRTKFQRRLSSYRRKKSEDKNRNLDITESHLKKLNFLFPHEYLDYRLNVKRKIYNTHREMRMNKYIEKIINDSSIHYKIID